MQSAFAVVPDVAKFDLSFPGCGTKVLQANIRLKNQFLRLTEFELRLSSHFDLY